MVELEQLRCFLVLAEELHFGRTAERLFLSQPRVSQTIRRLEQHIGAPLFERTSRRVRLTPLGQRFRVRLDPAYAAILAAVEDARMLARGVEGVLRAGFLGVAANELTGPILRAFSAAHPECQVEMVEVDLADPLGPLRAGHVDVLFARLPVDEPDLTVGPIVVSEPRALAVPTDHPFARRESVSIEDAARDTVFELPSSAPGYWRDFHVPRLTPSGRTIHRVQTVSTISELLAQVAAGRGISPMVESMTRFFGRPDVRFIPLHDLPWSDIALVWRTDGETQRIRALVDVATHTVHHHGGPEAGRGRDNTRNPAD